MFTKIVTAIMKSILIPINMMENSLSKELLTGKTDITVPIFTNTKNKRIHAIASGFNLKVESAFFMK